MWCVSETEERQEMIPELETEGTWGTVEEEEKDEGGERRE